MAHHSYNTRRNQPERSNLNLPGVPSPHSPNQEGEENITVEATTRVSGENHGESKGMESPLTSIASNEGPSNDLSAPAGPENETAPAGSEYTVPAGPDPAPPVGTMEQEWTSANVPAGGCNNATRNNAPEQYNYNVPPPMIRPQTPQENNLNYPKDKGKGPDARNWGNAGLNEEDIDPEIQAQILSSLQSTKDEPQIVSYLEQWKASETERIQKEVQALMVGRIQELDALIKAAQATVKHNTPVRVKVEQAELTKAEATRKKRREETPGRPSELVAPRSHIADIFTKLREQKNQDGFSSPEPSDDPSDDDSDNGNGRKFEKKRGTKMHIKPMKPTEIYEGNTNLRSLHRNMRETIAYCDNGNVPQY
ncbi:hypothetical protein GGU11DRAFT_750280 [Lentinula aff. detonsa]|nr:hypothetical protein GGU11DRAFT_750280 [Lentinula aff. detonsa]